MGFVPPNLENLKIRVSNLEGRFSILLGRYQIIKGHNNTRMKPIDSLIIKVLQITKEETDRKSQQQVLSQLVDELRPIAQEADNTKCNQAALFLLGALLHRYFRLIKAYNEFNTVPVLGYWRFFQSNVRDCRLFNLIRCGLDLPAQTGLHLNDYLAKDLEILDATTVVTALECFQRNMRYNARYKQYPHFAVDEQFFPHLQELIDEHKRRGAVVLKQFKAIHFLESLVLSLSEEQRALDEQLKDWINTLKKAPTSFKERSRAEIETHLLGYIKSPLRDKVTIFLNSDHITEQFKNMTMYDHLETELKKCNADLASYTIMGGCSLILELACASADDQLKYCVYEALETESSPSTLTDEDKERGIKYLEKHLEFYPELELNTEFFGGQAKFNTAILSVRASLISRIEKQKNDLALEADRMII